MGSQEAVKINQIFVGITDLKLLKNSQHILNLLLSIDYRYVKVSDMLKKKLLLAVVKFSNSFRKNSNGLFT